MLITLKNKKQLNIDITGIGENIVFIHSFLWDNKMWNPQIEELSKNYRCINIDLWGHGLSDSLKDMEKYSLEELAQDIKEALEILNISSYNYIGLSVGGMLGPILYSLDKDKLKKIVLMDSYAGLECENAKNLYFQMLEKVKLDRKVIPELANQIAPMFFAPENTSKNFQLLKDFYNHLINIKEKNINTIAALGKGIFGRKDSIHLLNKIDIPTLFLVGEHDIPRPKEESIEMSELVKNSKLDFVPHSGHISNLENSEFVTKKLKEFL
ncbi:alpha/beta fold hydrolase [Fusobacterium sp. MFO224]|uniref:alpha/beta fold hydrolase n=1 Tax=Fusobacterium sp. MFO224 TaxID=3378070 RepID=UPI0038518B6B